MSAQAPLFADLAPPRVLTLRQPWLDFILAGWKTIETRTWSTSYRGPLVLHAANAVPSRREREFAYESALQCVKAGDLYDMCFAWRASSRREKLGCVLAVATLVDVRPYRLADVARGLMPITEGEARFAWFLEDVRRIKPVPARGSLGLVPWGGPGLEALS